MNNRIFDTDFFKKLDTMALKARLNMNSGSGGSRKSKSKGSSVEFSDFREYSMGDDFRRIDWNAYGRFDKLFVKLFMEEREAAVNIFIDSSKSMDFGEPRKSLTALKLSAVFAFLALNNLDRVCINSMSGNLLKQSSTVTGKSMFDRCVNFMESIEFSGSTNINKCIKRKDIKNSGVSIIISDFFTQGGIEEAVKYLLFKKQEVVLVHLLSSDELKPDFDGHIRLLDSETGEARDIAVTAVLLKQYEKELKRFTNGIREFCSRMGASYIQISSEEPIEKIVFEELTRAGVIG